ncbi:MAG: SDR family NAD(P)-dependent oxidoreductase [Acidimicrobiales bacterium]
MDPPALTGAHALVTGASRGIGAALARAFADAGAAVTVTARTAEPTPGRLEGSLAEVVEEIRGTGGSTAGGPPVLAIAADSTDAGERRRVVDEAIAAQGPVTILVNNAAVTWFAPVASFDDRRFGLMMELQVRAPFHLAQLVLPGMRQAGRGWILNVSSLVARHPAGPPYRGPHGGTVYGMCKAALERFTTGLAAEVHADGIAVNVLSPSRVVPTPGTIHHRLVGRPGQVVEPPERFAAAALALCTGDPATVTGRVTTTDEVLGPDPAVTPAARSAARAR